MIRREIDFINVNACGVFEDGGYIYTTEKISEEILNATFRLTYLGEQELNVLHYKKVYSELIKHWIKETKKGETNELKQCVEKAKKIKNYEIANIWSY